MKLNAKLTKAQRYALLYYAAFEDNTPLPKKRWDARQAPRWDVVERLRALGLLQAHVLRLTSAGRQAMEKFVWRTHTEV